MSGAHGRRRPIKTFFRRLVRTPAANATIAWVVRRTIGLVRWLGPDRAGSAAEALTRFVGRFVPETKLALNNLAAAFPEKSEAERRAILDGVWRGLGRTVVEYVHLGDLVDIDPQHLGAGRVEVKGLDQFLKLREDGKPGIIFSAHLANWEMLAVVAARFDLPVVALYRMPSNNRVAQDLMRRREELMGKLVASGRGATFEVGAALDRGEHLGLLTDQHHHGGPRVPFFGRLVAANPLVARLARHYECPVHGARTIRLPDGRFRVELTPEIEMPRDAEGLIDVQAGTAAIMAVVEGWVREHPEQWLWLHNRWR